MNLRHTSVVEIELVVSAASHVQTLAARLKTKWHFAAGILHCYASIYGYLGRRSCAMRNVCSANLFCGSPRFVLLLQIFLEFAKRGIDGHPGGKNIDVGLDSDGSERAIAMVIDVIDRRRQQFV